jgi:hypothetical protein
LDAGADLLADPDFFPAPVLAADVLSLPGFLGDFPALPADFLTVCFFPEEFRLFFEKTCSRFSSFSVPGSHLSSSADRGMSRVARKKFLVAICPQNSHVCFTDLLRGDLTLQTSNVLY